MTHPFIAALLNETMQVGTRSPEQQPTGGGIGRALAQEFFSAATPPTPDQTLLGAVTQSLAKEAGLTRANFAAEFTVTLPPAPAGTTSELEGILQQAGHQAMLDIFGASITGAMTDFSHSLTQPSPVVEDQPNLLWEKAKGAGKWIGGKTKSGWQGIQTARSQKIAATKAAQAKAAADAETARQHEQAVRMQNEQTAARQRAAEAEKAYADARQQTARAEMVSATAATQFQSVWESFFSHTTSNNNQGPEVVDGEARDL